MSPQRFLTTLQLGLLTALVCGNLFLAAEAVNLWEHGGGRIPWPSLAEMVPFGGLLFLLTVIFQWRRRYTVPAALVLLFLLYGSVRQNGDAITTPLWISYFLTSCCGLEALRIAGRTWAFNALRDSPQPQIGLRTLLLLIFISAVLTSATLAARNYLDSHSSPWSGRYPLGIFAATLGAALGLTGLVTLIAAGRRSAILVRAVVAAALVAAITFTFAFAWQLESEWRYVLPAFPMLGGYVGVNVTILRLAGWSLEVTSPPSTADQGA